MPTPSRQDGAESGQIMVSLLLMMAIFLLAIVGFAVDLTNLWFHRQTAQTAADAACQAGAIDMAALLADATLPKMGFIPGTSGNCTSGAGTICFYANANGYNGAGIVATSPSNSVTWSFPASVPGVTRPPGTITSSPFLKVVVTENVKTHFLYTIHGTSYQKVAATCTCGIQQQGNAAPIIVLNPAISGAITRGGQGSFNVVGGPRRAIQVNSNSSTAIICNGSGWIDTSHGGPQGGGSDVGIFGGPAQAPSGCFNGGTTGQWRGSDLPIFDPYANVGPPASVASMVPASGVNGTTVQSAQSLSVAGPDGCPDAQNSCIEFSPGYYPSGIKDNGGTHTLIFLPGIYYMGGSLSINTATLRMATPCAPTCSSLSNTTGLQTDGVMFYFFSGSINIGGNSGAKNANLIPVPSTALTCDGSAPSSSLGMPSELDGNILIAQCTQNGTYWDAGVDTSDSRGTPGLRGLLMYQDHANTAQPKIGGGGSLSFSGAFYFHSTSYADVLTLNGGSGTGTFILGQIVADQIGLQGNGAVSLALNSRPTTELLKVGMMQ
ncbi:MAG TPA: pilus assembly protein TadG-related protein [Acidobacteriaceae bacterium]|nr:pilus assembly protein TadG-related protein [Acidobacteriaceae bacterium]